MMAFTGARSKSYLALKMVLVLLALIAGIAELWGLPAIVAEFELIGFGQWFRSFTGATLLIGAMLLSLEKTEGPGAVLLLAVCVGAFFAHLLVLHGDLVHTVIPSLLLGGIAWQRRLQIASFVRVQSSEQTEI